MAQRLSKRNPLLQLASFSTKPAVAAKPEVHASLSSFMRFQDLSLGGARVSYLTEKDTERAEVTLPLLQSILDRSNLYSKNSLVDIIAFASKTPNHFCDGLNIESSNKELGECVTQLREVHKLMAKGHEILEGEPRPVYVVSYDGAIADAGLTTFLSAKFRLASSRATYRVAALKDHGKLPLGGVAAALLNRDAKNIPMARYLAFSGARLNVMDLLEMNLVTNFSTEEPLVPLLIHAAKAPCPSEMSKRQQPRQIYMPRLWDAIDTMTPSIPEEMERVENDPFWERVLTVPPAEANSPNNMPHLHSENTVYPKIAGDSWEEIQAMEQLTPELLAGSTGGCNIPFLSAKFDNIEAFAETCFSSKFQDVKTIKKNMVSYVNNVTGQLNALNKKKTTSLHGQDKRHAVIAMQRKLQAATSCLMTLEKTDVAVLQTWLDMTRIAATKSLDESLKDEITMLK